MDRNTPSRALGLRPSPYARSPGVEAYYARALPLPEKKPLAPDAGMAWRRIAWHLLAAAALVVGAAGVAVLAKVL